MLWWVASTGFHIVLLGIGLASTTTISSSYLHIDHASHLKPVVFLSLILAILTIFEVAACLTNTLLTTYLPGPGYLRSYSDLHGEEPT